MKGERKVTLNRFIGILLILNFICALFIRGNIWFTKFDKFKEYFTFFQLNTSFSGIGIALGSAFFVYGFERFKNIFITIFKPPSKMSSIFIDEQISLLDFLINLSIIVSRGSIIIVFILFFCCPSWFLQPYYGFRDIINMLFDLLSAYVLVLISVYFILHPLRRYLLNKKEGIS